jgi:hypothetical protein
MRRDTEGRVLCSQCKARATIQVAVECNDCTAHAGELSARAAELQAELEDTQAQLAALIEQLDPANITDADRKAQLVAQLAIAKGAKDVTRTELLARDHGETHTHPVAYCDKHAKAVGAL